MALVNNQRFLFVSAVIFLSPFILFSFWNHLATDDFFIGIIKNKFRFWEAQKYYYLNWHGRYISILSTSILAYSGILYEYGRLIPLYFFAATFVSFLFAFFQVNKFLLGNYFRMGALAIAALVLMILEINVIPQPVTQFYWYSGAITYQQPLIWLFLLAGSLTGVFYASQKVYYLVASIILIFLVHGYNEMITIWILLYSSLLTLIYVYQQRRLAAIPALLLVANYFASALLLFAPGNFIRASAFDHSPIFTILGISFAKCTFINWFFLKEPLWWITLLVLMSAPGLQKKLHPHTLFQYLRQVPLLHLLLVFFCLEWLCYFTILMVSNGSIPYRMENALCFLQSVVLIMIIYVKLPPDFFSTLQFTIGKYKFLLLGIALFSTANMEKIGQTAMSGYFYNRVMDNRETALKEAAEKRSTLLELETYDTALKHLLESMFPNGTRKTVHDWITQRPPLLFLNDDLNNVRVLEKYYQIDSIKVKKE